MSDMIGSRIGLSCGVVIVTISAARAAAGPESPRRSVCARHGWLRAGLPDGAVRAHWHRSRRTCPRPGLPRGKPLPGDVPVL